MLFWVQWAWAIPPLANSKLMVWYVHYFALIITTTTTTTTTCDSTTSSSHHSLHHYQSCEALEENGKSMLFTESKAKAFSRHPLNDRNEHDTRRIYQDLILKHGWLKNVRGSPWAVKERHTVGDTDADRFKLISSATLVEAAYQAIESAPDNVQVKQLMQVPITGIVLFHPQNASRCHVLPQRVG